MPNVQPALLSHTLVLKAVSDSRFFAQVPEFIPLVAKMKAMKSAPNMQPGKGCGSCKQRRVAYNVYQDFLSTTAVLSPDAYNRLKTYLNIPALMFNARNPQTGKIELKVV